MVMKLPPKRKRERSGIERAPQRIWPRHRKFVKSFTCCVPRCQAGPVDFAHTTSRGAGGHDCTGVPLCRAHHSTQHTIGIETFQRKFGVDLVALAAELTRRSPDREMRASLTLADLS